MAITHFYGLLCLVACFGVDITESEAAAPKYNYKEVLEKSILFYEAQRSGKLPPNNRVPWRGDSNQHDHGINGEDLSGGWHTSGGANKNSFVVASATTVLSWGVLQYWDAYKAAGQLEWVLQSIKWPLQYFMKSLTKADPLHYEFYVLVGDPKDDDNYWRRPEDIPCCRPAYKVDITRPGSDAAAEAAAALAAGSIVFKEKDPCFSDELLQAAKDLFNFANYTRGKYSDSVPEAKDSLPSTSADDEIVWAATWLYRATQNEHYLYLAETEYKDKLPWAFDWDDKNGGYQMMLYMITGKEKYKKDIQAHINNWLPAPVGKIPYTPKGLAFRSPWGSLRYSANTAFLALLAADSNINPQTYREFAVKQINYMLGDAGRSYVVGFGKNPPVQPHHIGASCDPDRSVPCGWSQFSAPGPNPNIINGALVGGPDANDSYKDLRSDYQKNEVTVDYNAGFQSSIAGILHLSMKSAIPA